MIGDVVSSIEKGKRGLTLFPLKRSYEEYDVVGLDIETYEKDGRNYIYSVQLYSENFECFIDNFEEKFPDEDERMDYIISLLMRNPKKATFVFAHFLPYDMGNLFPSHILECISQDIHDEVFYNAVLKEKLKISYPNPTFMKLNKAYLESKKKYRYANIYFIDTLKFFPMSLEKASLKYNLPIKKMEKPDYLGKRKPNPDEYAYFRDYAMIDAKVVYHLGKLYMEYHKKYNINPQGSVSPATMTSKIFMKHFLKYPVAFPNRRVAYYSLRSYWGGRTEAFCGGTEKMKIYDYNSFYPYAMEQIFLPIQNRWHFTKKFETPFGFYKFKKLELEGWKISPLPVKQHNLLFPFGKFNDIYVSGFEAENIINEAKDYEIDGYVYDGVQDFSLKNYVDEFYRMKNSIDKDKNPAEYQLYKLILNSLYGKFIQLTKGGIKTYYMNDVGDKVSHGRRCVVGGMFNPAVASWITGFCRAELYKTMKKHEKNVSYCDTDSIGIVGNDSMEESKELGKLKLEAKGNATIIREKLYFVEEDGKYLKFGTHGFVGKSEQSDLDTGTRRITLFSEMVRNNEEKYKLNRMLSLKEANIQNKNPFVQYIDERKIQLYTSKKRENSRKIDFSNDFVWLNPLKF